MSKQFDLFAETISQQPSLIRKLIIFRLSVVKASSIPNGWRN